MANQGKILHPFTGNNAPRPLTRDSANRRAPYRVIRPMGLSKSAFVTTRCYNAAGVQIWDGDHGTTVHAMAVDKYGKVFQSGVGGSLFGDSLFHKAPTGESGDEPRITCMLPGGQPRWVVKQSTLGAGDSHGIAVTSDGYVYVGINWAILDPRNRIAKLSAASGIELLTLPNAGFYGSGSGAIYRRVRVDQANIPYAATPWGIVSWIDDTEYWQQPTPGSSGWRYSGLGVSDADVVYTSSDARIASTTPNAALFLIADATTSNLPFDPGAGSYLGRIAVPDAPDPSTANAAYLGTGTSPSGRTITYSFYDQAIYEISPSGDPDAPNVTTRLSLAHPGPVGSFAFNEYALGINDDGTYCYAVSRDHTSPIASHEIRDPSNGLIGSYDHGGAINDCVVLADGSVIVAGERVRRSDFP